MIGWVSIHRQMAISDLWLSEPFTRGQAWVDLIMLANHKDGWVRVNGMKVPIKRGQLAWSEGKLGDRWQWSRGKVRRFLGELETAQQIVQQKTRRNPLKTIVNYGLYQKDSTTDSTSNEPQKDHRQYNNNNGNNENNVNKETIGARFEEFWAQFPKQRIGNKKTAKSAYLRAVKENRGTEIEIIEGVLRYGLSDEVARGFAKGAAAWINDDRWTSDYTARPTVNGSGNSSVTEALARAVADRTQPRPPDQFNGSDHADTCDTGQPDQIIIDSDGHEAVGGDASHVVQFNRPQR